MLFCESYLMSEEPDSLLNGDFTGFSFLSWLKQRTLHSGNAWVQTSLLSTHTLTLHYQPEPHNHANHTRLALRRAKMENLEERRAGITVTVKSLIPQKYVKESYLRVENVFGTLIQVASGLLDHWKAAHPQILSCGLLQFPFSEQRDQIRNSYCTQPGWSETTDYS